MNISAKKNVCANQRAELDEKNLIYIYKFGFGMCVSVCVCKTFVMQRKIVKKYHRHRRLC